MAKRHYDETSVIRSLSRKGSIQINTINKTIEIVKNSTDVGNGSCGKIDYLHKVHGYIPVFVASLNKKSNSKKFIEDDDFNINNKSSKRETKFNMASMAKAAMKKVKSK